MVLANSGVQTIPMQPLLPALPPKQPILSPQATIGPLAGNTASYLKGPFEDPTLGLGIEGGASNSPPESNNSSLQKNRSTSLPLKHLLFFTLISFYFLPLVEGMNWVLDHFL